MRALASDQFYISRINPLVTQIAAEMRARARNRLEHGYGNFAESIENRVTSSGNAISFEIFSDFVPDGARSNKVIDNDDGREFVVAPGKNVSLPGIYRYLTGTDYVPGEADENSYGIALNIKRSVEEEGIRNPMIFAEGKRDLSQMIRDVIINAIRRQLRNAN